ncbi:MAG: flagellar filament capping protein FliD [Pseudomonadales bacterium]
MATISSIGSGSGIDLEGLVGQIIEAERAPSEQRLTLREVTAEASISAFGNLSGALDAFRSTLNDLSDNESTSLRTVTSSDAEYVSISADNDALVGTHDIQVLNLVSNHKLGSGDFATPATIVGHGTLTIDIGGSTFDVEIEEGVNDSIAGIRDAVNEAAIDRGLSASLITVDNGLEDGGTVSKLVLSSTKGGESGQISVTVVDNDGINDDGSGLSQLSYDPENPPVADPSRMAEISEAKDARITVDGFLARSSTNNFSDVLEGVEITANKPPTDELDPETATVTIEESASELKANLEKFVAGYNEVFITIGALTGYDAETDTGGLLSGDASVRQIETLLRRALFQTIGDNSAPFGNLASIGITTERDGTLSINSASLESAIEENIPAISNLVTGDDGVMSNLKNLVDGFVASDGIIKAKTEGLSSTISDIGDQRERLQNRLDAIEARFRSQFTGLDLLIAQLQSTGNFLTTQLASIASITSNRN